MCRAKRSARIRVCGALWSGNSRSSGRYQDHFLSQSPQYQAAGSLIWIHTHAFVGPGIFFLPVTAACHLFRRLAVGFWGREWAKGVGASHVSFLYCSPLRCDWCGMPSDICARRIAIALLTGADCFSGGEMKMYGWLYCEAQSTS